MDEPVGNIAADRLLTYFIGEIGSFIYNKAVADVQDHLQRRLLEIDTEVHEDVFTYRQNCYSKRWRLPGVARRPRPPVP